LQRSVALVHDYLLVRRGAERTFEAIADCWPEAPIYTLLYDAEGTEGRFAGREVRTSYLQRLGLKQRNFRALLPVFPRAMRALSLDRFDLVISSSSAFAHTVQTRPDAVHVCYCHSPFRYAWFEQERALGEVPPPLRPALGFALGRIRKSDRIAARRVSRYVANSEITRERISDYWGRSSAIIHPPVEVERFRRPRSAGPDFLMVTELVRHKRVDLALEAARRVGATIRVVGDGPDRERLEAEYGGVAGSAEFLGRVDDDELCELYAGSRAFVMPNVEEFGIAAVESQAAGTPVVAAGAGGALETVLDGKTGVLVTPDDVGALAAALGETDFERFDPARIVAQANSFSKPSFQRRLRQEVALAEAERGGQRPPSTDS
jgi:glycosyltransferase involved in cell wall biosynthesis